MLLKRFDSDRSKSIIDHCHSNKVTINDLFLAVLFESLFESIRPKTGGSSSHPSGGRPEAFRS